MLREEEFSAEGLKVEAFQMRSASCRVVSDSIYADSQSKYIVYVPMFLQVHFD
jgi:hypothetical protein